MNNFVASELTYRWITVNFSPGKLSGDVVSWRIYAQMRENIVIERQQKEISRCLELDAWLFRTQNAVYENKEYYVYV